MNRFFVFLLLLMLLGCSNRTFDYQVQVTDANTGLPISNASVQVLFGGSDGPVEGITDDSGIVILQINMSYEGTAVRRVVNALDYQQRTQNIVVRASDPVQIVNLASEFSALPTPTNTPTASIPETFTPDAVVTTIMPSQTDTATRINETVSPTVEVQPPTITHTPILIPTAINTPILTPSNTPSPTLVLPPTVIRASATPLIGNPVALSPIDTSEQNPVTFEWSGNASSYTVFIVYSNDTYMQTDPITAQSIMIDLPDREDYQVGYLTWFVRTDTGLDSERVNFIFDPANNNGGGDGGTSEPNPEPTNTIPPLP